MVKVSDYKLRIFKGVHPPGLSAKKIQKIMQQVAKMLAHIELAKRYTPFTSGNPRRRPRQVGA